MRGPGVWRRSKREKAREDRDGDTSKWTTRGDRGRRETRGREGKEGGKEGNRKGGFTFWRGAEG